MGEQQRTTIIVFPFEATLEDKVGPQKVKVHKLSTKGMILEVPSPSFRAQAPIKLKFTLPVEKKAMEEDCVIIKTYNQLLDEKTQKKRYLIEIHFRSLKPANAASINDLLEKIETKSQKKSKQDAN